jgi:hypothetical protein
MTGTRRACRMEPFEMLVLFIKLYCLNFTFSLDSLILLLQMVRISCNPTHVLISLFLGLPVAVY